MNLQIIAQKFPVVINLLYGHFWRLILWLSAFITLNDSEIRNWSKSTDSLSHLTDVIIKDSHYIVFKFEP